MYSRQLIIIYTNTALSLSAVIFHGRNTEGWQKVSLAISSRLDLHQTNVTSRYMNTQPTIIFFSNTSKIRLLYQSLLDLHSLMSATRVFFQEGLCYVKSSNFCLVVSPSLSRQYPSPPAILNQTATTVVG